MKVVIADDEPLARRRLEGMLAECAGAELLASTGDAAEALRICAASQPEVLLLDIRMPGLDGMAAARRLKASGVRTRIIFCTAYEQHALDAWEVAASDYLLKPVRLARLREALQRAAAAAARGPAWLHASRHGEQLRIALADVLWLEAGDKYVTAHLAGDEVLLEDSLTALLDAFPEQLLRLHRSIVVPRARLRAVHTEADGSASASIDGSGARLPISRRNLPAVRRVLRGEE